MKNIYVFAILLFLVSPQALSQESIVIPESIQVSDIHRTQVNLFMNKLGFIESSGNYNAVNRFGMLGKYQFRPSTIAYMGFSVKKDEFLKNPILQDSVMIRYMKHNNRRLYSFIQEFDGSLVDGVRINRATILAGAHFAGATGMRRFLNTGGKTSTIDSNRMNITNYIKKFEDVEIPSLMDEAL